jgi:hypothetical protein
MERDPPAAGENLANWQTYLWKSSGLGWACVDGMKGIENPFS